MRCAGERGLTFVSMSIREHVQPVSVDDLTAGAEPVAVLLRSSSVGRSEVSVWANRRQLPIHWIANCRLLVPASAEEVTDFLHQVGAALPGSILLDPAKGYVIEGEEF